MVGDSFLVPASTKPYTYRISLPNNSVYTKLIMFKDHKFIAFTTIHKITPIVKGGDRLLLCLKVSLDCGPSQFYNSGQYT